MSENIKLNFSTLEDVLFYIQVNRQMCLSDNVLNIYSVLILQKSMIFMFCEKLYWKFEIFFYYCSKAIKRGETM